MKDRKHGLGSFPTTRMRRNRLKNFSRRLIKENNKIDIHNTSINNLIIKIQYTRYYCHICSNKNYNMKQFIVYNLKKKK